MKKKRLITSALPYVNNLPHLGTLIGCVLSADVFYKYCKIAGYETLYICGTDEYGTTTETRARQEGVSPRQLCDKYYLLHKEIYEWFDIEFSHFGRTTHAKQTEIVQQIFKKLYAKGYISEDTLIQPYCHTCRMFLADRYIEGICPHCGYDKAKGDQCENCGKLIDPADLKKPHCVTCAHEPEFKETRHLFLNLDQLKPQLEQWVKKTAQDGNWSHNAVSVTNGWIEQGLQKRCITRDLEWGIPVPLPGYEGKVFYVWFDAPIGYISITAAHSEQWQDWWKNPHQVELYQFIGKDNIPFHTVLFPSSLLGTGEDWTMLKTLSSTEYLNYEDLKFSKSRGTGVFGDQARETGIEADLFRYYLIRNRPEKNDTQFYWFDFMEKVNGEIIANYANLVNRVLQFTHKFFDQKIPDFDQNTSPFFNSLDYEQKLNHIIQLFEQVELKKALLDSLELCSQGNKYFQDQKPWQLIKTDPLQCGQVIGTLCAFIKDISILLYPIIPKAVLKVFDTLNLDQSELQIKQLNQFNALKNKKIKPPLVLFKKLEKKQIQAFRDKFSGQKEQPLTPGQKFSRLHLKVGRIIEVERHPKADKLYIEKIDLGNNETRQIVSGLVPYYEPRELLDKNVIIVCNLKPAQIRGVKSQGMLLAAENKDRSIVEVISPEAEIGSDVLIDQAEINRQIITIDEFAKIPLVIKDYFVMFAGNKLKVKGNAVKVEKVKEGKAK